MTKPSEQVSTYAALIAAEEKQIRESYQRIAEWAYKLTEAAERARHE